MPWEKSFDRDVVLDAAMETFWASGYRGVSMADLVDMLGINRSSLYNTYGSKEQLFMEALARYDRVHRAEWLAGLGAGLAPIESIRQAFADITDAGERPDGRGRLGCLLVNTTLELPADLDGARDLIQHAFEATERFFEQQLDLARDEGDLPPETDTASLATALMALMLGIRVLCRAQRPSVAVRSILTQVDSMLQSA